MRLQVLKELGYQEVKCEVWKVNDKETKILLATLNKLRGSDDVRKRAVLVHDILSDFGGDDTFLNLLPESSRSIESLLNLLQSDLPEFKIEQGLIEEQLLQSGVDADKANWMSNLYRPPSGKLALKFEFKDDTDYIKVMNFFGEKPDTKKLVELIELWQKQVEHTTTGST